MTNFICNNDDCPGQPLETDEHAYGIAHVFTIPTVSEAERDGLAVTRTLTRGEHNHE